MKYKIYNFNSEIVSHKEISSFYYKLSFKVDRNIIKNFIPGKFLTIKCGNETFFRRPFTISSVKDNTLEIIYKKVGPGTSWLAERKKGDYINILGPLGNGFTSYKKLKKIPVIVAGGTGIVSFGYLAKELRKKGILFYGVKSKTEIVCDEIFRKNKWKIFISTEDGSCGEKGVITDIFKKYLEIKNFKNIIVYACGPYKMLKIISLLCEKKSIECYVLLEEIMACGVGACRGCVIKTKSKEKKEQFIYKTVCKDGPVFNSKEIIWE